MVRVVVAVRHIQFSPLIADHLLPNLSTDDPDPALAWQFRGLLDDAAKEQEARTAVMSRLLVEALNGERPVIVEAQTVITAPRVVEGGGEPVQRLFEPGDEGGEPIRALPEGSGRGPGASS